MRFIPFELGDLPFLLDGKQIVMISGELHRMQNMGINTIGWFHAMVIFKT